MCHLLTPAQDAGMSRRTGMMVAAWAAVLLACSDSPAALPATGPRVVEIELQVDSILEMAVDETRMIPAVARLSDGSRRALESPVWSSSQPGVATVVDGTVAVAGPGYARISVREGSTEATFWVRVPFPPTRFSLELVFAADVPEAWRQALRRGADRWREVIREPLPPFEVPAGPRICGPATHPPPGKIVDGSVVFVETFTRQPFSVYPEAVGGPCMQRPLPTPSTVLGVVSVQPSVVHGMTEERLAYVAHHELGHALGLVGVIQGFQPTWFDPETGIYTAPGALEGYARDTGIEVDRLLVHGTAHWPMPHDVMSNVLPWYEFRHVSIGALRDLGYTTDWHAAGPYLFPD